MPSAPQSRHKQLSHTQLSSLQRLSRTGAHLIPDLKYSTPNCLIERTAEKGQHLRLEREQVMPSHGPNKPSLEFTEKDQKQRKYHVSGSSQRLK